VSVWNYEALKQKQFTHTSTATESHFKAPIYIASIRELTNKSRYHLLDI